MLALKQGGTGMTVCVCVKVNECMVFAADSATSMDASGKLDKDGAPIQQVYRHGNKVFQLHRDFPIMAMTSGVGNFGPASIAMLAKEFRAIISPDGSAPLGAGYTMEQVTVKAHEFFLTERYAQAYDGKDGSGNGFELWIGGYSDGRPLPELWQLSVFQGKVNDPQRIADADDCGIWYGGQRDPIMRLVHGFGWRLEQVLREHNITPESHADLYKKIGPELYLPLAHPAMPIQDAIDLADFLADMTKKVFRFRAVPEYVSGEIDIATITNYERFRWIKRKHYYPQHLNQGTDHAH
ncbi:hypothetical protein FKO01_04935 [Mesorhizobium sp. B2-3-3]|nr:hypothetical protein FKO01_04935 [Mesorhizobium sp. B2-3-3]